MFFSLSLSFHLLFELRLFSSEAWEIFLNFSLIFIRIWEVPGLVIGEDSVDLFQNLVIWAFEAS